MSTFIIKDWADNHLFPTMEFETFEDGWEYVYENIDDEEMYQDIFVVPKS